MAQHVCPWWVGYILNSPIRRLSINPMKLLSPHVRPDMTVLDAGCAMGFFSLPLARLVGPKGRVICADLQERMIKSLKKRADKADLSDRIETHVCSSDSLGLNDYAGKIDFALAFHTLHEVPDIQNFLAEIHALLVPGAALLIAEPKGHVSAKDYAETLRAAEGAGFSITPHPDVKGDRTTLLQKPR